MQRRQHQIKMLNKLIPFIVKLLHIIQEVGEEGSQGQEGVEEWDVAEEQLLLTLTITNNVNYTCNIVNETTFQR